VGDNHQDVDALREKILCLPHLNSIVPIRRLNVYFGAEFSGAFYELIAVMLPSFQLQRVEGYADPYGPIRGPMPNRLATSF
jgi:hypothetical protein